MGCPGTVPAKGPSSMVFAGSRPSLTAFSSRRRWRMRVSSELRCRRATNSGKRAAIDEEHVAVGCCPCGLLASLSVTVFVVLVVGVSPVANAIGRKVKKNKR